MVRMALETARRKLRPVDHRRGTDAASVGAGFGASVGSFWGGSAFGAAGAAIGGSVGVLVGEKMAKGGR